MSLSNADLIKNALFGSLPTDSARDEDLEDEWLQLEGKIGVESLDSFFGNYRTVVNAAKARGSLFEEMEPLIQSAEGGPFGFLDRAGKAAENYRRIVAREFTDGVAFQAVNALSRVEYDDWIPPLLAFMGRPVDGLSEHEYLDLLERITMQNWIRRLGRTARMTVYFQLINAIKDGRSAEEVRDIFRRNSQNAEFLQLLGGDLYGRPFDSAVLLRLDEATQDESVTRTYSGEITIEHVLPQALKDPYWRERFTEEQHLSWVHRLGNLTLLSGRKNYRAQYFSFDRKKTIYIEKNKKAAFDLTKEVIAEPEWTTLVVADRHSRLMALAGQTWAIA